jgi:alkylhydroperoxidase family enzyme
MNAPYLQPIEKPSGLILKLIYSYSRKRFGKVMTPLKVVSTRMPLAFGQFSGKISQLDKKLKLPAEIVLLIRQRVSQINMCTFCMDISRAETIRNSMNQERFDALNEYQNSKLFSEKERALLNFVTMLAQERKMNPEMFAHLAEHYDERSICEIIWIVSTEFYYNIGNIGLNIHSDMLCDIAKKTFHK